MTQEQKARKFEDFLDKMRGLLDEANRQGHIIVRVEDLEHTFPELKESEEERIRKELIFYLGDMPEDTELRNGVTNRDVLVWLEKQGEKTSWKPSKEEMDVLYGLAYITNQYNEHKEEVITRLYQDLKREFFNGSSYENMFPTYTSTEDDVRRRSTIQVLEYARSLDTYNQYGKADIDKNIAWLEKQGEQKHFDYENANIQQKDFAPQKDIPRYSIGDVLCDKSCTMLNKESQSNFEITDIRNGLYICDKCSFPISQQDEYELVAKRIESAWSEKDEENFRDIVGAIHAVAYQTTEDEESRLEWLYDIKQRMGG